MRPRAHRLKRVLEVEWRRAEVSEHKHFKLTQKKTMRANGYPLR